MPPFIDEKIEHREEKRTNMKIDTLALNTAKGRSISFNSVNSETINKYMRTSEEKTFEKQRWMTIPDNVTYLKK